MAVRIAALRLLRLATEQRCSSKPRPGTCSWFGGKGTSTLISVVEGTFMPIRSLVSCISLADKSVQVREEGEGLRIRHEEWPEAVFVPFVWLRDHCRCDQCFSHVTLQRQAVIDPSWLTLKPRDVTADDTTLSLTWPDGHRTLFSYSWIWDNTFEGQRHRSRPATTMRHLWNTSELEGLGGVPRVPYQRFMDQEEGVAELIKHLVSLGVGIVDQTPATVEATRKTAERLCPIMDTFWGSIFSLEENPQGNDLGYSNQALHPHVDGTYFSDGPGLQVFHALEASPIGGETILVDGFAAADRLSQDAYSLLSSCPIVFESRDEGGQAYLHADTILKHHPITAELHQIRFCPNDLGPLSSIQPSAILSFYQAYSGLLQQVQQQEAIFLHRLSPGEVLFVDNWRVMHGRRQFSGRRLLAGCYLARADYLCKARMLKVID